EKNESITLEMTFEGQRLEKITNKLTELAEKEGHKNEKLKWMGFSITENFWKQLSKGYAKGAIGKVTAVLLRRNMRVDNIYEKDEKPLLLKNLRIFLGMTHREIEINAMSDIDHK